MFTISTLVILTFFQIVRTLPFKENIQLEGAEKLVPLSWEAIGQMSYEDLDSTFPKPKCFPKYASPFQAASGKTGFEKSWTSLEYIVFRVATCSLKKGKDIYDRAKSLRRVMGCSDALIKDKINLRKKVEITFGVWQCMSVRGSAKRIEDDVMQSVEQSSISSLKKMPELSQILKNNQLNMDLETNKPFQIEQMPLTFEEKPWPQEYFGHSRRKIKRLFNKGRMLQPYYSGKKASYGYPETYGGMFPKMTKMFKKQKQFKPYYGGKMFSHSYPKTYDGMSRKMKKIFKKRKMFKPYHGGKKFSYAYPKTYGGISRKMKKMFKKRKMLNPYYAGKNYDYGYPKAFRALSRKMKSMLKKGKMFKPYYGDDISHPTSKPNRFSSALTSQAVYDPISFEQAPYEPGEYQDFVYGDTQNEDVSLESTLYENKSYEPTQKENDSYQPTPNENDPYQPPQYGNDPYQPASYMNDTYQPLQYENDPYQAPQYENDPYQPPQYGNDPYQPASYKDDPYQSSQNQPISYEQPGEDLSAEYFSTFIYKVQ
ncbi:hypothetical protein RF11_06077 [Thelohanellus kitauei]|uniref:Uncharacterized protein n=1 Tax=Thelohanellus kitauei TaxID=669202 RepID=A0A0C2N8H8_THEKT|nr:hypothetical protein RF11_06077 [Thelohanellus kitauei]